LLAKLTDGTPFENDIFKGRLLFFYMFFFLYHINYKTDIFIKKIHLYCQYFCDGDIYIPCALQIDGDLLEPNIQPHLFPVHFIQ